LYNILQYLWCQALTYTQRSQQKETNAVELDEAVTAKEV